MSLKFKGSTFKMKIAFEIVFILLSEFEGKMKPVGIGMAILPLEGIYPQIKRVKVLFKTKTNNLPLICNSTFQTGRQCL